MRRSDPPKREISRMLNEHGEPIAAPPRRSFLFRLIRALLILGVVVGMIGGVGVLWFLDDLARTPREWAPYLDRRAQGHRPSIVNSTALVTGYLLIADRLTVPQPVDPPPNVGAAPERSGTASGRLRFVSGQEDLRAAVANAEPGDVIQLIPGRFAFGGRQININRPGLATAPITIRAARLGDTVIEANQGAVFKVFAPHWRIENLTIRGVCAEHRYCEHAFHVVRDARGTVIRNNRMEDLNAAIKINGERGQYPDNGLIDGNTFIMTSPRDTLNPITPIDLVGASNWLISRNFIADFARHGRLKASYGAFVKGGGENNVMERNVVFCEWKLHGNDERVGLSLGGGGTDPPLARDQGRSGLEQIGGVIRDNLIAFCSDVGVYVNKASRSVIEHNTLLDTAGIDIRFPLSSADVVANVVDGAIRPRDGGVLRAHGNEVGPLLGLFLGYHPVRDLFRDPGRLDLAWRARPTTPGIAHQRPDLCGTPRPIPSLAGAFEDFTQCR
jgi:hypothetical protein